MSRRHSGILILLTLGFSLWGAGLYAQDENSQPETPVEAPTPETAQQPDGDEQPPVEENQPEENQPAENLPEAEAQPGEDAEPEGEKKEEGEDHAKGDGHDHDDEKEHKEGESHGDGHGDDHPKGAPLGFKADLAIWTLVTFVLFLIILKKMAWAPLTEGLDKREARIREDIAAAEAARVKSERLLAEHEQKMDQAQEEVREIIAEARRDADQARQNILDDAQKESAALRERTLADIERAKDAALKDLFAVMSDRVTNATEHVLGRALSDDDQQRLVSDALSQLPDA